MWKKIREFLISKLKIFFSSFEKTFNNLLLCSLNILKNECNKIILSAEANGVLFISNKNINLN